MAKKYLHIILKKLKINTQTFHPLRSLHIQGDSKSNV